DFSVIDKFFEESTREVMKRKPNRRQIWNINYPDCAPEEVKGILYDCIPAKIPFYQDHFEVNHIDENTFEVKTAFNLKTTAPKRTDIYALINNYVAAGKVNSNV
ncbi:MAG: hypothetical protein K5989_08510, partial [Lachnospiraceae bacterium]|nr:hypothetical protein [Lachnospiraceae bacterium]